MEKIYKFGNKPMKKSWDSSEFEQSKEDFKLGLIIIGMFAIIVIANILIWSMKHH